MKEKAMKRGTRVFMDSEESETFPQREKEEREARFSPSQQFIIGNENGGAEIIMVASAGNGWNSRKQKRYCSME